MARSAIKLTTGNVLIGGPDGNAIERTWDHDHPTPLIVNVYDDVTNQSFMRYDREMIVRDEEPGVCSFREFYGASKDNNDYVYREILMDTQPGGGTAGSGLGIVQDFSDEISISGVNLYDESASIDYYMSMEGTTGKFSLDITAWQEAGTTPWFNLNMDPAVGISLSLQTDSYKVNNFVDETTGICGTEIVGGVGSYISLNTVNIWMDGSYMPPRNWGILAAAPASDMIAGDMYYNSATSKACYYTGAAWVNLN